MSKYYLITFCVCLFSYISYLKDYRGIALAFYLLTCLIMTVLTIINTPFQPLSIKKHFEFKDNNIPLFILLITSICIIFFKINSYPFVSIWDPVRDGGLLTQKFSEGLHNNYFSNGPYNGFSLLFNVFLMPFYKFFGNNTLAYRIPGALMTLSTVFLLYFYAYKTTHKRQVGLWSAFIYLTSPFTLFFYRSEALITLNSFSLVFLSLIIFWWDREKNRNILYFLGFCLGFFSHFHVGIIPVLFIFYLYINVVCFLKKEYKQIFLLNVFILIGVGPRIFEIDKFYLQQKFSENGHKILLTSIWNDNFSILLLNIKDLLVNVYENYKRSIFVYFYENANDIHAHASAPLVPFYFGIYFIIGIIKYAKINRLWFLLLFLLPLFVSAITTSINIDNRVYILTPIAAYYAALGLNFIYIIIKKNWKKKIFVGLNALFVLLLGLNFFRDGVANQKYNVHDFAITYLTNGVKERLGQSKGTSQNICIHVSEIHTPYFVQLHVQEFFNYFLFPHNITVYANKQLTTDTYFVTNDCGSWDRNFLSTNDNESHCETKDLWTCPKNPKKLPFYIYYKINH